MVHLVEHHDEMSRGSAQHFPQTEQQFSQRESTVGVTGVKLVEDALGNTHAGGSVSAVHMSHLDFAFTREVAL